MVVPARSGVGRELAGVVVIARARIRVSALARQQSCGIPPSGADVSVAVGGQSHNDVSRPLGLTNPARLRGDSIYTFVLP